MSLQARKPDWPDGNFLCALTQGIWFSDGKTCQIKSMGKVWEHKDVAITYYFFF